MTNQRIAIIDIGSNSVRLVVYEKLASGSHRVIEASKRAARLSEQIDSDGKLAAEAIGKLIQTINHFLMICDHHQTKTIRAVATAAIRNAVNGQEVLETIRSQSGLQVELLSGEEEAYYGFVGMINALAVDNGFLIDIGGGSTEVSLFRNRKLEASVSFPFGCVSLTRRFGRDGMLDNDAVKELEAFLSAAVAKEPWISQHPDLPLIGVGGTVRALGKIHQAYHHYPIELNHNYQLNAADVDQLFHLLQALPLDKRRKFPGLSKDRTDVIVPGLAILRLLHRAIRAKHYLVCGTGLRDGLFHATCFPGDPIVPDVLDFSISQLIGLHPETQSRHAELVRRVTPLLFDELKDTHTLPRDAELLLQTASSLFRIGASIDYYAASKHSFYLIVNSQLNGLTHRQIVLAAAIASYKGKNRLRQQLSEFRELLHEADFEGVVKLGMLLQLAMALDRSETQTGWPFELKRTGTTLLITGAAGSEQLAWEQTEVKSLAPDFKKAWGFVPEFLPAY
ncbi:Ppx/GppA family phosphatase [Paenibacillus protaetiae]|uniref:Ppx/GppA family phosphatase n=1 Tax=Paenibacillus protaetiae TaxID=2509456 RepID=A0A4P6ERG3_9BACL|nr:Ppx/GppA family phosphatase [Paenibacillus protaetiae]QAY65116.1 Ppx/GppA family phosphatase [Paenibacillus protaetiae]